MKKIKLLMAITLLVSSIAKGQITLEHSYPNSNFFFSQSYQFNLIKLSNTTYRYFLFNSSIPQFTLYYLNHSIDQVVHVPVTWNSFNYNIFYVSKSLFDCDSSNIDYLVNYDANDTTYVKIFNIDGTLLFFADSATIQNPEVVTINLRGMPIVNTPNGTKMILFNTHTGTTNVYSLCGTLTSSINNIEGLYNESISNPYPNPTNNITKIDYELPPGINEGEIVFYNLQGAEVKRFKVDRTFNTLLISTKDLAAGTYLYQLQTSAQSSEGKKMVVIK